MNNQDMEQYSLGTSHYGFSGASLSTLGASEYTLVTIAADESGSVAWFQAGIEKCLAEIVTACQKSPRKDNLLLRLIGFGKNSNIRELHGFKLLDAIKPEDYRGILSPDSQTPLWDATINALEAAKEYGQNLYDHDYTANGILIVITDGCENHSRGSISDIVTLQDNIKNAEVLESLVSILVGVNITEPIVHSFLEKFSKDGKFTQYVELDNADSKTLAKLAAFVSKSISSQSNSLGSGGASKPLTF